MKRWFAFIALTALFAADASAQTLTRGNLATILGFENSQSGLFPVGWGGSGPIFADDQVFHTGKLSARIERTATTAGEFNTVVANIPVDFSGQSIQWCGYVKTEDVSTAVSLWLRLDGASSSVAFNSTQGLAVNGTTDWKQYCARVPYSAEGRTLVFGFLVSGSGKGWVDTLELSVDGRPVAQAPARVPTVLETDTEFNAGSRVAVESLSDLQVANLATLGKVWGFLKYHHPSITGGRRHWDYDLFRVLPAVLRATSKSDALTAISTWIAALGPVPDCSRCATLDRSNLQTAPDLDWLADERFLGTDLSQTLQAIYRNRSITPQFFVEIPAGAGNPSFARELSYASIRIPDSGFNPNREIMADDPAGNPQYWSDTLTEFIRPIALAKDRLAYQQELLKLITKINDTHANLWSSIAARPPLGACYLPVDVRFVEGKLIVLRRTARDPAAVNLLAALLCHVERSGPPARFGRLFHARGLRRHGSDGASAGPDIDVPAHAPQHRRHRL